jgi:hypothetical protein
MISSSDLPSHSVPGDQLVAVVDIGLVVQVVVIFQRLLSTCRRSASASWA